MKEYVVRVHRIAEDGLPDMAVLEDRVLVISQGAAVSGRTDGKRDIYDALIWTADEEVGRYGSLDRVTHWIELPVSVSEMEGRAPSARPFVLRAIGDRGDMEPYGQD